MLRESSLTTFSFADIFLDLRLDKDAGCCAYSFINNNEQNMVMTTKRITRKLLVYECLKLQFIVWLWGYAIKKPPLRGGIVFHLMGNLFYDVSPAAKYSAFRRAILLMEISFGQTASQAPVLVQAPNPSLSICAIILTTRDFLSGSPCGSNAR